METAIIISRCSTNETKQDVTRQTHDLKTKYANRYNIVKEFEYYKSGTANDRELSEVLTYAISNKIDHLLFTEVSRIARRVIETLVFIRSCTDHRINVLISQYDLNTLNNDRTENLMTTNMLNIAAIFANMELQQTKQRLNSGRAKYIKAGGRLGRNEGSIETPELFVSKHKDVAKYLRQGQSVRTVMKLTGKSSGTVQKVKKIVKETKLIKAA